MDRWLTSRVKELIARCCLEASEKVGNRLNDRVRRKESIDERALTEDLVDFLDSNSETRIWKSSEKELQEKNIYITTNINKSSIENKTGTDIGLILKRQVQKSTTSLESESACLIQCKKIDLKKKAVDFFHEVGKRKVKQSALMLDRTPSSFYFVYTPPKFLKTEVLNNSIFISNVKDCYPPLWDMGYSSYPYEDRETPRKEYIMSAAPSILVVPALAVKMNHDKSGIAKLDDIVPNTQPFWYWFSELFLVGVIGDSRQDVIRTARNLKTETTPDEELSVDYSIEINITYHS